MVDSHPGSTRVRLLGGLLAGILAIAFAWLGAVDPQVRVGLHVGVALALLLAAQLQPARLASAADRVFLLMAVAWVLSIAAAVGLLPLRPSLSSVVAPGLLTARPDDGWWTAALSPEDVFGAVAVLTLLVGFAVASAVWGAQKKDSDELVPIALGGAALFIVLACAHALSGTEAAFGWIRTTGTASGPFLGPLVNQNHVGSTLLLVLPLALQQTTHPGRRLPAGGLVLAILGILIWAEARGPMLIATLLLVVEAVRRGKWAWAGLPVLGLPVVLLAGRTEAHRVDTVGGRLQIWRDGLSALADYPLFGVGAGGYEGAVEPYRTDMWRATIAHAHNDFLEYLVETGLVGVAAAGLALFFVWRARPRGLDSVQTSLLLGVAAVGAHALVDFPLSVPAIAMASVGLLAVVGARGPKTRGNGGLTRRFLWLLIALNVGGAALCWQRAVVDRAEAELRAWESAPQRGQAAADTLVWWAPWRGWDRLHAAWVAERAGDSPMAIQEARMLVALAGDDDDALRPAALLFARNGETTEAAVLAERARSRGDVDYRNHVAIARIAARRGDVDAAVDAYVAAFERDAPYRFVKEAWDVLPVAVFWIDRLEHLPRHTRALALLLTSRGDPEEALLAFDQASASDPSAPVHPIYALALARGGHIERALEVATELAATGDTVGIRVLGEVREALGDPAGALEAWRQVEDTEPAVRSWMIRVLRRSGDPEGALALADRYRLRGDGTDAIELETARTQAAVGDGVACRATAAGIRNPSLAGSARQACAGAARTEGAVRP